jgi:hypothetical protein
MHGSDDLIHWRYVGVGVVGRRRVRAQVAVEQDVPTHTEHAIARPAAVTEPRRGRKTNRWTAVSDDDRSDRDLQSIEQVRLKKGGNSYASPFHENAPATARAKETQGLSNASTRVVAINSDDSGRPERCFTWFHERSRADVKGRAGVTGKDAIRVRQSAPWIEYHSQRIGSGHVPDGELRIVIGNRPGADHDGVRQRPHPVQVNDVVVAGDEL